MGTFFACTKQKNCCCLKLLLGKEVLHTPSCRAASPFPTALGTTPGEATFQEKEASKREKWKGEQTYRAEG